MQNLGRLGVNTAGLTRSRTGEPSQPMRSRRWTTPTTWSRSPTSATGAREWRLVPSTSRAFAQEVPALSTTTSRRGFTTSLSVRSAISKAPEKIARCSGLKAPVGPDQVPQRGCP